MSLKYQWMQVTLDFTVFQINSLLCGLILGKTKEICEKLSAAEMTCRLVSAADEDPGSF